LLTPNAFRNRSKAIRNRPNAIRYRSNMENLEKEIRPNEKIKQKNISKKILSSKVGLQRFIELSVAEDCLPDLNSL